MRVPLRGGKPQLVARTDGTEQGMLVLEDTLVFVQSRQDEGDSVSGDVVRVGLHGGATEILASASIDVGSIFGPNGVLASDGHDVFFATRSGVMRVPLEGGEAKMLTEHKGSVAIIDSKLVVADGAARGVFTVPKAGGDATKLAGDESGILGPVVGCGQGICWANAIGGARSGDIMRLDSSGKLTALARGGELFVVYRLVADGDLFFASMLGDARIGSLLKVEPGAASVSIGFGSGLAVKDDCLYMASVDGVTSVAKSYAGPDTSD